MLVQMQEKAFQIIAIVGTAKSSYIEAMREAKNGNFDRAEELMTEAKDIYSQAHKIHFELVQLEASGTELPFSLLLAHAEDQLLNTETIQILVEEIIVVHAKMQK